ncbi:hypothetical protein EAG_10940 [Camponotus floridanus]|uniref:Uncharacterized protein n=1 Tax=Camponotus floridanus TaxID=104421 RepID=E2ALI1_CAMFO|nr:hypothetical protein EAG_10940 [Camponotus floridanus]
MYHKAHKAWRLRRAHFSQGSTCEREGRFSTLHKGSPGSTEQSSTKFRLASQSFHSKIGIIRQSPWRRDDAKNLRMWEGDGRRFSKENGYAGRDLEAICKLGKLSFPDLATPECRTERLKISVNCAAVIPNNGNLREMISEQYLVVVFLTKKEEEKRKKDKEKKKILQNLNFECKHNPQRNVDIVKANSVFHSAKHLSTEIHIKGAEILRYMNQIRICGIEYRAEGLKLLKYLAVKIKNSKCHKQLTITEQHLETNVMTQEIIL